MIGVVDMAATGLLMGALGSLAWIVAMQHLMAWSFHVTLGGGMAPPLAEIDRFAGPAEVRRLPALTSWTLTHVPGRV